MNDLKIGYIGIIRKQRREVPKIFKKCKHRSLHSTKFVCANNPILISYKRASLACAARLAGTSCPPEAPFGRLWVTLGNYKGDTNSKYVHLSFKIDITRKIT